MKLFLYVLAMTLPLSAFAAEHGGKAMSPKPASKPAAEHAGQPLPQNCDTSVEECAKSLKNGATSEHGGTPMTKKPASEHGGQPAPNKPGAQNQ